MKKYQLAEAELSYLEQSCIPFALYQFVDKRVVTIALSAGFCKLFGYQLTEAYYLMDNDMYRDTHPDDVVRVADAALKFAIEGGEYSVVYRTKTSEGYRIVHAHGEHIYMEDGTRLAVVWYGDQGPYTNGAGGYENLLNQSFNRALHEETLVVRNRYDQLTGLPNMTYFFELAEAGRERLLAEGKKPVMLFFNLNGMKFFNRKHGFAEGDKLIKAVAKLLVKHFGNECCSRFAQDHFAAFSHTENLEETLQLIFEDCARANDGKTLPMSVGVYFDQMGAVDVGTACDRAKYACDKNRESYISKYHFFNEELLSKAENQSYVIDNLDKAIADGWIEVYYQPIVRAANGKVCDEEALARWIDPERGMLSPADFIPVLEEAKLIYKLDLCVIEEVLRKMKRQADAGLYVVPQSVNLSRADFDAVDIVEEIRARVDASGLERDKLTIEITESMVGSDFDFMKEQIERFQGLGFKVWMDDFGSGYSTLDVLQNIHFDLIKLDMRFMERFGKGDESKVILTELVRMAMGLGIETVAEGVEEKAQVDFLREIGCSKLQGFYYCKPIPLEGIVERNEKGIQIGFENPEEAEYYSSIGRVNLYDAAIIAQEDSQSFGQFFDTLPMAIAETNGDESWITRSNRSYREYVEDTFGITLDESNFKLSIGEDYRDALFLDTIRRCGEEGGTFVIDEETGNDETVHSIIKRIAVNPVKNTAAVVVVVLAVVGKDSQQQPVTYANIAKALSSDYRYLFYVNIETENFVEFSSNGSDRDLSVERHGDDFFQASRNDALKLLHESDQERFRKAFTKENVLQTINQRGAFTISYRMIIDGKPRNMLMKAACETGQGLHLIIGVSDIETQERQRREFERIQEKQIAYTRINALSDEYMCIYIVDLGSEIYEEYSSTSEYKGLGIAKVGDRFFSRSREESATALYEGDHEAFLSVFTKEHVTEVIRRDGAFILNYRLLIDGIPTPVKLKAVIVEEGEGDRLVIGVRQQ